MSSCPRTYKLGSILIIGYCKHYTTPSQKNDSSWPIYSALSKTAQLWQVLRTITAFEFIFSTMLVTISVHVHAFSV
ncbi:hypothetical protein U9M48_004574 [Paspalum notatum var. saurae]|uniref:Uncharacterized protein n=1 Tax=Paspalum notatum var. saurae TaxID=547442 RepID=A0AAQ3PTK3_PASNO